MWGYGYTRLLMILKNKNFKDKNDKHKYKKTVKYENKVEIKVGLIFC